MSDQAQVSGGSSQVYWKSRSDQPWAEKELAHEAAGPMSSKAVIRAPASSVAALPSRAGP